MNSLQTNSGHSRRSSDTSQVSELSQQMNSECSQDGQELANNNSNGRDIWQLWGYIMNDWNNQSKKKSTIQDLVRKGIPHHLRGMVWQLLCNAQNSSVRDQYSQFLSQSSVCEKVIKRDIARTYPEHDFFKEKGSPGQEGLFNVMKAYSIYDSEVGYCQGSAFLVGVLLLNMPEEDAFAVFTCLMQDYRLREMYKPTMAELGLCIYQLECMVQELLPELYMHFQSQNYFTSMYASSWFLTLFTSCLPLHIAYRVLDLILLDGIEMIFRISIAILLLCKEDLLRLDMEGLLKYFQKEMPSKCETDPDYLVNLAAQVKYDPKKMKKLAKDYQAVKNKEQEELVELRRLRTENRLLRQRIENLEQESAELADKLIQGQVCRAQEAEDNFVIKRELAASRQQELEVRQELDKALNTITEMKETNSINSSLESQENQQLIESLQEELIAVKLREAENNEEMKILRERINELEEINDRLHELPPDHAVAQLQEELIAVKLREAEANLSIKDLRHKITDLQQMWSEHMSQSHGSNDSSLQNNSQPNSLEANGGSNPSSLSVTSSPLKMLGNAVKRTDHTAEINRLKNEVMSAKLREAEAVAELKELRQKVMELETQIKVSINQIRRQADESNKLKDSYEELIEKERQTQSQLNAEKRHYADLDFQMKEQQMMKRIKELEQTQIVAELKHKISSLEAKIEEHLTITKLNESGSEPENALELQNRMAELQSEMFRLEVTNKKLSTLQNGSGGGGGDNDLIINKRIAQTFTTIGEL
ncbi:ecotropic viral integration site 5 ortholog-like isoform X2 [Oppia nitens]|nr:ecotropic viral integration site 5 ortholog-like isoform X2 [Oppia nitens]